MKQIESRYIELGVFVWFVWFVWFVVKVCVCMDVYGCTGGVKCTFKDVSVCALSVFVCVCVYVLCVRV